MSTGNTVQAALFLCLVVGEAFGNAVKVLTPRAVRHPEVPCALTLILPLFQRADNDSAAYAPRLFVFGKADWLDEFLRRFPRVASIYVFTQTEENIEKFEDFILAEMMPSASIVLRVAHETDIAVLNVPMRVRYIVWASFDSDEEADDVMSDLWLVDTCHSFFGAMVTARPRGTTHVFAASMPCRVHSASEPVIPDLLGVWSPGAGWSAPHVPLFPPLCASWRPPPDGGPLLAQLFIYHPYSPTEGSWMRTEAYEVMRLLRDSYGLVFELNRGYAFGLLEPLHAADTCRLDAMAFVRDALTVKIATHTELSVFPWENDYWLGIVPVGAGKPRRVLYPLTAEYTPEVWAALAAVVLAVVACLYLMRRDESVQELVLQTLSPLLGQPLDEGRGGPQIAVLGGWLLTCVVVVGAYQGQLLGFITVPPNNGEINSWQDWLESDLQLLAGPRFLVSEFVADGLYNLTEERLHPRDMEENVIETIASQRNVSILMRRSEYEILSRDKTVTPQYLEELFSKLHTFELPLARLTQSSFVTTKGSPLEEPIRKILGRIHAAGGFRYKPDFKTLPPQDTEDKPISFHNIMPIFVAYAVGNILAVSTFLLEQLPTQRKSYKKAYYFCKRWCQLPFALLATWFGRCKASLVCHWAAMLSRARRAAAH